MSGVLRLVLGDQLTRDLWALEDVDRESDQVLMAEVAEEAAYVPHHKKKLAFVFSAMRHFARELKGEGLAVRYIALDDPENSGSLIGELRRAIEDLRPDRVIVTEAGEWRLAKCFRDAQDDLDIPLEIRQDSRFLASHAEFETWAKGRKQLRMEFFYREMRKRYGVLLDPDGEPAGGAWNFDAANRKRLPGDLEPPSPLKVVPDEITRQVLEMVARRFGGNFGDLEPFWFAVDAAGARRAFDHFVEAGLPKFGDYQDAMRQDEPFVFHAVISLYLNAGLLRPLDLCRAAEAAWERGDVPLNAAEGFIRQILGWREFVRGIYWREMPGYAQTNALNALRPLPDFYWTGETEMNCMAQAIGQTRREAYAHHIQRLMVTGNFALLAGLDPKEVSEWYLAVYADAYEWVELPNTHGMALFADGGLLASKPYAASGKYIDRMSDYCTHCRYDVKESLGETACPFNALYWNFLAENRETLNRNPRLGMIYRTFDRMDGAKRAALRKKARAYLLNLA